MEGASASEAGLGGQLAVPNGCGPEALDAPELCLAAVAFSDLLFCLSSCSYRHMSPDQYMVCSSKILSPDQIPVRCRRRSRRPILFDEQSCHFEARRMICPRRASALTSLHGMGDNAGDESAEMGAQEPLS